MQLRPSDPDIRTIVTRIEEKSIDLQPDFQRGLVWPLEKQQRLIDTILRNWHVPPVHLIAGKNGSQVVLDGQQRLRSIFGFFANMFSVNGSIEPMATEIQDLHGRYYRDLPLEVRRTFDKYPIRVIEVYDYSPGEPYELFYRLNQPTPLTSAERRNALFGPARDQVRRLADLLDAGMLGFSNSRMAYDDSVARFCLQLEYGTLRTRVGSQSITDKYRSGKGFDVVVIRRAEETVSCFVHATTNISKPIRFNKATLHTWLCVIATAIRERASEFLSSLPEYLAWFEESRSLLRGSSNLSGPFSSQKLLNVIDEQLLMIFNDRATSRVLDVSSAILRDAIVWSLYVRRLNRAETPLLERLNFVIKAMERGDRLPEMQILQILEQGQWGDRL